MAPIWFEISGSWVLMVPQMEACSTGFRASSPEFLFNYTQIILFMKSHRFGKCSHLIFLYIVGYTNISWRLHDPHPKLWGLRPNPLPRIDAYACFLPESVTLTSWLPIITKKTGRRSTRASHKIRISWRNTNRGWEMHGGYKKKHWASMCSFRET